MTGRHRHSSPLRALGRPGTTSPVPASTLSPLGRENGAQHLTHQPTHHGQDETMTRTGQTGAPRTVTAPRHLRIGDRIRLHVATDREIILTVWQVTSPGTMGRRYADGPTVYTHTRPGGYGMTLDNTTRQQWEWIDPDTEPVGRNGGTDHLESHSSVACQADKKSGTSPLGQADQKSGQISNRSDQKSDPDLGREREGDRSAEGSPIG